jgi:hypothetical protein
VNIFCCGLVCLAPARCAHEILLNLITHKSTLTKVLRNQLPPLRLSALQSPPTTLSLNLNKWNQVSTLIDLWNAYRYIYLRFSGCVLGCSPKCRAVAMDFGEYWKEHGVKRAQKDLFRFLALARRSFYLIQQFKTRAVIAHDSCVGLFTTGTLCRSTAQRSSV